MAQTEDELVLEQKIAPIKIGQIPYMLVKNLPTLVPDNSVSEAAAILNQNRIGMAAVIAPDDRFLGVLSKTDIVQVVADWPARIPELKIKQLYTSDAITCTTEDSSLEILKIMRERDLRHLPVVDGNKMIGILSVDNLRSYLTPTQNIHHDHHPTTATPEHEPGKHHSDRAVNDWVFDELEGETIFQSYIEDDDLDENGEPNNSGDVFATSLFGFGEIISKS